MTNPAFVSAVPVRSSQSVGRARSGHVCERRASRSTRVLVARAAFDVSASAGPSFMDEKNESDDGGDGFFGDPGDLNKSLGMPMPRMNKQELEYFNNARNEEDRLYRLKEIAKVRHNEIIRAKMETKIAMGDNYRSNPAEAYMDRLAKQSMETERQRLESMGLTPPAPLTPGEKEKPAPPPRLTSMDFIDAKRKGMNAGELYMDMLMRGDRNGQISAPQYESPVQSDPPSPPPETTAYQTPEPSFPTPAPSSPTPEPTFSDPEVPSFATNANGLSPKEPSFSPEVPSYTPAPPSPTSEAPIQTEENFAPTTDEPSTLDRQIAFLEQHLSKLQDEDEKDASRDLPTGATSPQRSQPPAKRIPEEPSSPTKPLNGGFNGAIGELSEEETETIFQAIRQARLSSDVSAPADPLAASLPERRNAGDLGLGDVSLSDGPGEMTEDQIRAKFEEVRRQNRESLAKQLESNPASVAALKSVLLALKAEHMKYIEASRRTLAAYERNLENIIGEHLQE